MVNQTIASQTRYYLDLVGCWIHDSRRHVAPIRPYSLINISPESVNYIPVKSPDASPLRPSPVIGGPWDLNVRLFSQDIVYRSFCQRFKHGSTWKETPYYQFIRDRIRESGSYKGISDPDNAIDRCKKMDKLYQKIKHHGYTSQRKLAEQKVPELDTEPHLPPERKEITVHISRTGDLLWAGGIHRLSIAKILKLNQIPVRIHTRHKQWQRLRDSIFTGDRKVPEQLTSHPDLQFS